MTTELDFSSSSWCRASLGQDVWQRVNKNNDIYSTLILLELDAVACSKSLFNRENKNVFTKPIRSKNSNRKPYKTLTIKSRTQHPPGNKPLVISKKGLRGVATGGRGFVDFSDRGHTNAESWSQTHYQGRLHSKNRGPNKKFWENYLYSVFLVPQGSGLSLNLTPIPMPKFLQVTPNGEWIRTYRNLQFHNIGNKGKKKHAK